MEGIDLELAIKIIRESVQEINDTEEVELQNAKGRIISEDIYAPINQPPFNRSPLDGYAVKSIDTVGASKDMPKKLKVIGEVFAGGYTDLEVKENEAIRIMTGAPIPKGADCIIKQEDTDYAMDVVEIYSQLSHFDNYCFIGEDIKKGSKVISKGEKLTYIHIGLLAILGITKVNVKRKLSVAVISTGDELVKGGINLSGGKIYDSNRVIICSRLLDYGCEVFKSEIMGDDDEAITKEIDELIDKVDLIITTGGVSVGKKDIMHDVIKKLGAKRLFWKVLMKPGSPAIYLLYKDKPILCLSGNPFASIATFEIMGKELIYNLTKDEELKSVRKQAIMQDDYLKKSKVRRFIRAVYKDDKVYLPKGGHSSGMLGSMLGCNCFIEIKQNTEKVLKGEKVDIFLL